MDNNQSYINSWTYGIESAFHERLLQALSVLMHSRFLCTLVPLLVLPLLVLCLLITSPHIYAYACREAAALRLVKIK